MRPAPMMSMKLYSHCWWTHVLTISEMLGSNTLNYTWHPILSALDIIISIVRKGCMLKKFSGCRHFCVTVLFLLCSCSCSCLCMSALLTMTDSVLSNNPNNSHICILINLETVGKNSFISWAFNMLLWDINYLLLTILIFDIQNTCKNVILKIPIDHVLE